MSVVKRVDNFFFVPVIRARPKSDRITGSTGVHNFSHTLSTIGTRFVRTRGFLSLNWLAHNAERLHCTAG